MRDLIHVRPAPDLRRPFAVWATAQTPKIRTVTPDTFAVPAHLFVIAPEEVLIGATVDGHRYVSPVEDEQRERQAVPGQVLPEVPPQAYGPDAVPLPPAVPDDQDEDEDEGDGGQAPDFVCPDCPRAYATERGLSVHRTRAHTRRPQ
jgi:hypothetical protein